MRDAPSNGSDKVVCQPAAITILVMTWTLRC